MWGSKKSSVDVLDIPDLHRRKLIKLPERESDLKGEFTNDGFFDLSNQNKNINQTAPAIQEQNNQTNDPVTDFLSDFASIGASNPSTPQKERNNTENNEEVSNLKWRIENLEFKLEQMLERLNSLNK